MRTIALISQPKRLRICKYQPVARFIERPLIGGNKESKQRKRKNTWVTALVFPPWRA